MLVTGIVTGALALLSGLVSKGLCSHVNSFYPIFKFLDVVVVLDLYTSISIYFKYILLYGGVDG